MLGRPSRVVGALAVAAALCCALAPALRASDTASAIVSFHSDINASSSLRVSSSLLTLEPGLQSADGRVVLGTIEFRAAARTRSDGEVVLTVETPADLGALVPGSTDGLSGIDFTGIGDGAVTGRLRSDAQVAGRWVGSGVRSGQIVFSMRGPAAGSSATVPLRFVLSLP